MPYNKPLHQFFTKDHHRLSLILNDATKDIQKIDLDVYHKFRIGLLKHIKMEEKILFPAAQKANNGVALPLAAKLRLDHGALTSLMVLPPTKEVITIIQHILKQHDQLEEEQ